MDGPQLNSTVGFLIALVGVATWAYVAVRDPHRSVGATFMLLLSFGMLLVSTSSLLRDVWLAGVIAAANRVIVAGLGIRAVMHIRHDEARHTRHEP